MRHLLLIILTVLSFAASAQVENKIPQYTFNGRLGVGRTGNNDTTAYLQVGPNGAAKKGVKLPMVTDTAQVLGLKTNGLTIFSVQLNQPVYWDSVIGRWKQMGGSLSHAPGTGDSLLFTAGNSLRLIASEFGVITTQYTNEVGFAVDTANIPTRYTIDSLGQIIVGNFPTAAIYEGLPGSPDSLTYWRNDSTLILRTPVPGDYLFSMAGTDTSWKWGVDTSQLFEEFREAHPNIYTGNDSLWSDREIYLDGKYLYIYDDLGITFSMIPKRNFNSEIVLDNTYDSSFSILAKYDAQTYADRSNLRITTNYENANDAQTDFNFQSTDAGSATASTSASNGAGRTAEINYVADLYTSSLNFILGVNPSIYFLSASALPDSTATIFPFRGSAQGDTVLAHDLITGQLYRTLASGTGGGGSGDTANLIIQNVGSGQQTWYESGDSLFMKRLKNATGITWTTDTDSSLLLAVDRIASVTTIGATPNANGASVSGTVLNLQPASASFGGVVTTGTQTFAGSKTFNNDLVVNGITVGEGAGSVAGNTTVGATALDANTSGSANTALGYIALSELTGSTSSNNTAVGSSSGYKIQGARNSGLGSGSLGGGSASSSGANDNTAGGYRSLYTISDGDKNTFYGALSGDGVTTSSYNIGIGYNAMNSSNADSSLVIGNGAGPSLSGSGQLRIGHVMNGKPSIISGDMDTDTLRINAKLHVSTVDSSGTAQNMLYITQEGVIKKAVVPSGGGGGGVAEADVNDFVKGGYANIAEALGASILYTGLGMSRANITGTLNLGDGIAYYIAIHVTETTTLTGVRVYQTVKGNYTGDNSNEVQLYSYSGGTMTEVATSGSSGTLWSDGTSQTYTEIPFTSTYNASPGVYYIGILYNNSAQTTAPAVGTYANLTNLGAISNGYTNSAKSTGFRSAQTSLPSSESMSNLTGYGTQIHVELY